MIGIGCVQRMPEKTSAPKKLLTWSGRSRSPRSNVDNLRVSNKFCILDSLHSFFLWSRSSSLASRWGRWYHVMCKWLCHPNLVPKPKSKWPCRSYSNDIRWRVPPNFVFSLNTFANLLFILCTTPLPKEDRVPCLRLYIVRGTSDGRGGTISRWACDVR